MRHVDEYGRVTADMDDLVALLYAGGSITSVLVEPGEALERHNQLCDVFFQEDHKLVSPSPMAHSPEEEHRLRSSRWNLPFELRDFDVREYLLSLCDGDAERARINEEMDVFEQRGLVDLLRTMVYLVDHFRTNKVVWGVGRGSSVASYALFKIGVHKIDSLKYGLHLREFLK